MHMLHIVLLAWVGIFGPLDSPIPTQTEELVSDAITNSTNKDKKAVDNRQSITFEAAIWKMRPGIYTCIVSINLP